MLQRGPGDIPVPSVRNDLEGALLPELSTLSSVIEWKGIYDFKNVHIPSFFITSSHYSPSPYLHHSSTPLTSFH